MRKGIGLLLLLVLLAGCGGAAPRETPSVQKEPPAILVDGRVTAANTAFGIALLQQVFAGENTLLSPVSASLILSLTAGGAGGETQAEMLRALRYEGLAMEEIHRGNGALQLALTSPDPKVTVALANAIWHRSDLKVAPAMAGVARQYGATIAAAPFGDPAAVQAINAWTAKATREKIPTLLESTTSDDVMVLVNALYFKGDWTHAFDPKRTQPRLFMRANGTGNAMDFMQMDGSFGALQEEGLRAVRLPYGQGRMAMYLFVPADLPAFVAGLTAERWEGYLRSFTQQQGLVAIPKFKLEATHPLNDPMMKLGLDQAMDMGRADFAGLFTDARPGVAIKLILQKTFLEVNEQGAEAAAATAVVLTEKSMPQPLLLADRPFLLAIRDDQTGTLLFLGAVTDPNKGEIQ